jgi:hypothetical protein
MVKIISFIAVSVISLTTLAHASVSYAGEWMAVLNSSVPKKSITVEEAKKILQLRVAKWDDGSKVTLVVLKPEAPQADSLAQEFLAKSAIDAKKYWLGELFKGSTSISPKTTDSVEDLLKTVEATPGAIAILPIGTEPGSAHLQTIHIGPLSK